jgi:hypothetical protein
MYVCIDRECLIIIQSLRRCFVYFFSSILQKIHELNFTTAEKVLINRPEAIIQNNNGRFPQIPKPTKAGEKNNGLFSFCSILLLN